MGDPHPPQPGEPPPDQQQSGHLAVTSKSVGDSQSAPKQMRTFAQILADEKEKRNILEIKLIKILYEEDGKQTKPEHLSLEKIGELMFDVIS